MNTSKLFNDIKKKYKKSFLILTDTKNFKNDFSHLWRFKTPILIKIINLFFICF